MEDETEQDPNDSGQPAFTRVQCRSVDEYRRVASGEFDNTKKESLLPPERSSFVDERGSSDCSVEHLEHALRTVDLPALVPRLRPAVDRSDEHVRSDRDWFTHLSGGERQRLCVARLLLRLPKMVRSLVIRSFLPHSNLSVSLTTSAPVSPGRDHQRLGRSERGATVRPHCGRLRHVDLRG